MKFKDYLKEKYTGRGWWLHRKSNVAHDISEDLGITGYSDHVGFIYASENGEKLGLSQKDQEALKKFYTDAIYTQDAEVAGIKIRENWIRISTWATEIAIDTYNVKKDLAHIQEFIIDKIKYKGKIIIYGNWMETKMYRLTAKEFIVAKFNDLRGYKL